MSIETALAFINKVLLKLQKDSTKKHTKLRDTIKIALGMFRCVFNAFVCYDMIVIFMLLINGNICACYSLALFMFALSVVVYHPSSS